LQCVAVCCSVLQCVAVCCSVLQGVAVCCSVLQCVPGSQLDFLNWKTINLLKTIKNPNFEWPCGGHDDFAVGPTQVRSYLAPNDPRQVLPSPEMLECTFWATHTYTQFARTVSILPMTPSRAHTYTHTNTDSQTHRHTHEYARAHTHTQTHTRVYWHHRLQKKKNHIFGLFF